MNGYIKLHRKLLENPLWTCAPTAYFRVALVMLLNANWKDRAWFDGRAEIVIPRGSLVCSRPSMCRQARVTAQQYRGALAYLQLTQFLTSRTTNRYTIVTITNYERYQGEGETEEPTEEPQNNQQTTTPEEGKNCKKDLDLDHAVQPAAKNGGRSNGSLSKSYREPVYEQFPKLRDIMQMFRPGVRLSDRQVCSVMTAAGNNTELQVVSLLCNLWHRRGVQRDTATAPRSWKYFADVVRRELQELHRQREEDEAAADPEQAWDKAGEHV